jgi:branched-chain amino acid transport system permease protein
VWTAVSDVFPISVGLLLLGQVVLWALGATEEVFVIVLFINLTLVLGLQVFVGNTGIVSFGQGSFIALAAYGSGLLTIPVQVKVFALPHLPSVLEHVQLPFLAAAGLTVIGILPVAALVGIPIVRLSGAAASIATFALLVITQGVLIGLVDFTRGVQTFYGLPHVVTLNLAITWAIGSLLVARLFANSRVGLLLKSSSDDELAARAVGVRVRRLRLYAWVVSCGITAGGGALLAHTLSAFSPAAFYLTLTLSLLTMLIVGGARTTSGAVVGTLAVTAVFEVLRRFENGVVIAGFDIPHVFGLQSLGLGVFLLLAMIFRRQGILGIREPDLSLNSVWRRLRTARAGTQLPGVSKSTPSQSVHQHLEQDDRP